LGACICYDFELASPATSPDQDRSMDLRWHKERSSLRRFLLMRKFFLIILTLRQSLSCISSCRMGLCPHGELARMQNLNVIVAATGSSRVR
jgi:hypothetical protein